MTWISNLIKTYDFNELSIGKFDNRAVLLPIFHMVRFVDIEIYIDQEGNFIRAEKVPKDDQMTIFPETEDSTKRGYGEKPKPLFDNLSYIAGDYDDYMNDSNSDSGDSKETDSKPQKKKRKNFDKYIEELEKWVNSDYSCDKIESIYKYLKKEQVMHDLDKFDFKTDGGKSFVRFVVESPDSMNDRVWEDSNVQERYIEYTRSRLSQKHNRGICYATGNETFLVKNLSAGIRTPNDSAKLISSNDENGLTFRGRFKDAEEAMGIGYVESEKAYNALRWLIAKQGQSNGSESIVIWGLKKLKIETPFDDLFPDFSEPEVKTDSLENYAFAMNSLMNGYYKKLGDEIVSIITVDSLTGARLAITYYNEMPAKDYVSKLYRWYKDCSWKLYFKEGRWWTYKMRTPLPKEISRAAYGIERNKKLVVLNAKLQTQCVHRILSCITENRKLPNDILRVVVNNASNPRKYTDENWEFVLSIACALIRKHNIDYEKGEYNLMLEEDKYREDRDYLFGMLLAVLDSIETTYYKEKKAKIRPTKAKILWDSYCKCPAGTFDRIWKKLQPYLNGISDNVTREYYWSSITHVVICLRELNSFNNKPLKENYLLGYFCERADIEKNIKKEEE